MRFFKYYIYIYKICLLPDRYQNSCREESADCVTTHSGYRAAARVFLSNHKNAFAFAVIGLAGICLEAGLWKKGRVIG